MSARTPSIERAFLLQLLLLSPASAHAVTTAALPSGLVHLWTTPILRHTLVDGENADMLQEMETAVMRNFRAFADTCGDALFFDGETMNDRFFAHQRDAFENDQPCFLEQVGDCSSSEVDAFLTLREAWFENIFEYVAAAASEDAAELMFAEPDTLRLHVWASVHEGDSAHVPHDHENSAVSGVFYVAVPAEAGEICFEDPRAARLFWGQTPFAERTLTHTPRAGELLLFPPWLVHSVGSSAGASTPRVSISFNLFTTREGEEDLEALANTLVRHASWGDMVAP